MDTIEKLTVFSLLCIFIGACCNQKRESEPTEINHESQVRKIITEMWTPDKDFEKAAIEKAATIQDPRITEALIGKLKSDGVGYDPEYWYPQAIIYALKSQGLTVEITERTYRVKFPDIMREEIIPITR